MTVKELVEILKRSPQDNIILVNTWHEESVEIMDVLLGTGTTRGFTYLLIGEKENADAGGISMNELKPCPFCGGEPKAFQWGATYEIEIVCQNEECDAVQSGRVAIQDGESEEKAYERAYRIAKEKWNRRGKDD